MSTSPADKGVLATCYNKREYSQVVPRTRRTALTLLMDQCVAQRG